MKQLVRDQFKATQGNSSHVYMEFDSKIYLNVAILGQVTLEQRFESQLVFTWIKKDIIIIIIKMVHNQLVFLLYLCLKINTASKASNIRKGFTL